MSKLKLNFATPVVVTGLEKTSSAGAQNVKRAEVQALINANPLVIDRSAFKKTEEEKIKVANEKSLWKKTLK